MNVRSMNGSHPVAAGEVRSELMSVAARHIVLTTFGSLGDIQPFLAIGSALAERGYRVTVATSEVYGETVEAASLRFRAVRPNRQPGQQDPDFVDRLFRVREAPAAIYEQMFLPSLRESCRDLIEVAADADALVIHPLASAGRLVAEALRIPWISAVMQPMGYLSAFEPPIIGPPAIARLLRTCGPGTTRQFHRLVRGITGRWSGIWHDLRAELGLPPSQDHPLWEGQHSPILSLGLFPRVLGRPMPDWPASARVTGFPFYRSPGRKLTPDLARFIEAGESPIVFTLGTTAVNDPGSFYDVSAEAIARLGMRAVLVAGQGNLDRLNALSPDVIAVPFAPHDLLFRYARAIVHQGGIGTLSEALWAQKPMLIMPYGHDQADNAWRAARLGVARVISRRAYRPANVARELEALAGGGLDTTRLALIRDEMESERGAERAAGLIDQALGHQECTYTPTHAPLLVST